MLVHSSYRRSKRICTLKIVINNGLMLCVCVCVEREEKRSFESLERFVNLFHRNVSFVQISIFNIELHCFDDLTKK